MQWQLMMFPAMYYISGEQFIYTFLEPVTKEKRTLDDRLLLIIFWLYNANRSRSMFSTYSKAIPFKTNGIG